MARHYLPGFSSKPDPFKEALTSAAAEEVRKIINCIKEKYSNQGLGKVFSTSGGAPFINQGNIFGRDPLGFLNCLCNLESIAGVSHSYEPNPAGDCVWGNWGVNRGPLPTVSDLKNNSCASIYGITEMRTNKTPLEPIAPGAVIKEGEQIQTTGKTILAMSDGSELLVDPYSVLTFTSPSPSRVLVNVQQGGARILSAPGGSSNVEVLLGDRLIRPKGTEYTVQWDGKAGSVAVVEGSLIIYNETRSNETLSNETLFNKTLLNETGPGITLEAGQQLELPAAKISPYNISTDDGGLFVGLPLRELILDDSEPEPYGEYEAAFADGTIPEGWIWQDPGKDAEIETPENGTLKVTVPDGNELWGYPGSTAGQRTDAPRLFHKATGDFDMVGQILLKSNCTNYAGIQFVLYSPGSNLGILANQMKADGIGEDFRIMGGSWSKMDGLTKLDSFNKDFKECPDAPNTFVKVKLIRRGDEWKSYWSLDGNQWNLAARQVFNASDTVWVGWVFKRNAYDGLTSEPAIITLKDVRLTTAPRDSMESPNWDLVQWPGTAIVDNASIRLALNGSVLGDVAVHSGRRFEGDLDAVVRFDAANWTGNEGERRDLALFATDGADKNDVYIGNAQTDGEYTPQIRRYETDLRIDGSWGRYQSKDISNLQSDLQGYLRIVRHNGNFSTYYWSECQWVPLADFKTGFTDPVYIGVRIDNSYRAKKPVPLAVDFKVEQILAGEAVSGNWTPTYCSLIQPVPLPTGITLPQGVEAKIFKPAFALGTIFFGPDGTAYTFSSERGKQKLMAIDGTGTAQTYAESEILAGINRKTGVFFGSNILMTVDGWNEGGNRYIGIYELNPNGTFHQWNLKSSYGGLGYIISASVGGWYFSDFEADNIWHLSAKDTIETPLITKGDIPPGLAVLAYDSLDDILYTLNWVGDWPFGGTFAVYEITKDGEATLVAKINETSKMNGGMALSRSGPFGHALYVSDAAAGKVLKVTADGTIKPVISGLVKPGEMQFNPVNGDLLIVCDEGKSLLWVGSDLSRVGIGSSAGLRPSEPESRPALDLSGDWIMQGRQTGVDNSDFKANLALNANGTLNWIQTEGANVGAARSGTWDFDGKILTMKWSSTKGGQITWTSSSVKPDEIADGTYTAERVSGGTWSALRSAAKAYESESTSSLQSSSLLGDQSHHPANQSSPGSQQKGNEMYLGYEKKGYKVYLDGNYVGTEGRNGDTLDGNFIVHDIPCWGSHTIVVDDGEFTHTLDYSYDCGIPYSIYVGDPLFVEQISNKTRILTSNTEAGPAFDLSGCWIMQGKQIGVDNSDFKANLTLNPDGTLSWIQTEGANVGATRNGTWVYSNSTITMKWSSRKGGQITWISSSCSPDMISGGTYTAELVSGGTWSASRQHE